MDAWADLLSEKMAFLSFFLPLMPAQRRKFVVDNLKFARVESGEMVAEAVRQLSPSPAPGCVGHPSLVAELVERGGLIRFKELFQTPVWSRACPGGKCVACHSGWWGELSVARMAVPNGYSTRIFLLLIQVSEGLVTRPQRIAFVIPGFDQMNDMEDGV